MRHFFKKKLWESLRRCEVITPISQSSHQQRKTSCHAQHGAKHSPLTQRAPNAVVDVQKNRMLLDHIFQISSEHMNFPLVLKHYTLGVLGLPMGSQLFRKKCNFKENPVSLKMQIVSITFFRKKCYANDLDLEKCTWLRWWLRWWLGQIVSVTFL